MGGEAAAVPLGTTLGAAAGLVTTRPAVPVIRAGLESVEKVLQALVVFFRLMRARGEAWLAAQGRTAGLAASDVLALIAEEGARQGAFEVKVVERVRRDVTLALSLPEGQRVAAIRLILDRERRYARQRSEAMAVRAFAAIDRVVLRRVSPAGAFWELDPDAMTHTAGCRVLAGHAFDWGTLDAVHPPFGHAGCRCRLRALGDGEGVLPPDRAQALVARALAAEAAEHGH